MPSTGRRRCWRRRWAGAGGGWRCGRGEPAASVSVGARRYGLLPHYPGAALGELKLGEFKSEHKGQEELYLKWLAKHEQQLGENAPIAIIPCSDKDAEVVELVDLEKDQIHVAEYWLQLPPQELPRDRLHRALVEARTRLELRVNGANEA